LARNLEDRLHSKTQAAKLARAAQRSVPLRGTAAHEAAQRRAENRLVSRKFKNPLARQGQAAIARWGADAQQGESRMDRKEGQNL
jgi:hypothetical protein